MNEKCAACVHCEVCGFIESEVAKDGACAFYEDGKKWELTKEEKALLQKWRDNRGISMKDFEDAMDALEQEPCEDAISRQAVLDALCDGCELFKNGEQTCFTKCEEYHFLATLPPVTPQHTDAEIQKMQDLEQVEIKKAYELGKADVLDKIRTEIETKYGQCDICEYFENYDYEENDISEYRPIGNIADVLQIIDKYKAESGG